MKKHYAMAVSMASVAFVASCAMYAAGTPPVVSEALKPPSDELLLLVTPATGVQIYECSANKDQPARYAWLFRAPEAELFDRAGKLIGKHYAGPTWEANDGSKVVGQLKARDDGPDANAIPWLLLTAKSTSGSGIFDGAKSIQRVDTVGGKAPDLACGQAQAGNVASVPYRAIYYIYGTKS